MHSKQNIISGFRATGLIPFQPERVLDMLVGTPTPPSTPHSQPPPESSPWILETPRNLAELAKQIQLVQTALNRLSQSLIEPLAKVVKGCKLAMAGAVLYEQRIKELEATVEHLQKKKI